MSESSRRSIAISVDGTGGTDTSLAPPIHTRGGTHDRSPMSPTDVRSNIAGMEILRAQNNQLQAENDNLKRLLSQSERDRDQDVKYMRALLGRRLCRNHAQSFKLRRLLIKLHAQILDIARVINQEQRTSEMAENMVLSVQDPEHSNNGQSNQNEAEIAADQRTQFLVSLQRLKPARVSLALQENMERLFENMHELVRRCPRYREELNGAFTRSIQLKEALLSAESKYEKARIKGEEMEHQMNSLSEETSQYRKMNEQLSRDMRLTLDIERKRRLKENQQYIKARTSLYKQILADKQSPLHPAQLSKTGKHSNLLNYTPSGQPQPAGGNSKHAHNAALAQSQRDALAAQQHAYYLERRAAQAMAQAQADAGFSEMTEEEQRASFEAYMDENSADTNAAAAAEVGQSGETDDATQVSTDALPVSTDPVTLSDGRTFDPTRLQELPQMTEEEVERREEEEEREREEERRMQLGESPSASSTDEKRRQRESRNEAKEATPTLPPIDGGGGNGAGQRKASLAQSASQPLLKATYANPFWSPIRPRPSQSYTATAKAELAYRNSNEWIRAQAQAQTNQRLKDQYGLDLDGGDGSKGNGLAGYGFGGGGGGRDRGDIPRDRHGKPIHQRKESMMHPTHSPSFGAAQKIFAHSMVTETGEPRNPRDPIDPNGWNQNWNSPQWKRETSNKGSDSQRKKEKRDVSPTPGGATGGAAANSAAIGSTSPVLTRALHALDDARTAGHHASATAQVHDSLLALRSTFTLESESKKDKAFRKVSRDMMSDGGEAWTPQMVTTSNSTGGSKKHTSPSRGGGGAKSSTGVTDPSLLSTSDWVENLLAETGMGGAGGSSHTKSETIVTTSTSTSTSSALKFHHTPAQPHATVSFKSASSAKSGGVGASGKTKVNGGGSNANTPILAPRVKDSSEPFQRTIPVSPRLDGGFF